MQWKITAASILVFVVTLQLSLNAQGNWELITTTGDIPSARKGHSMVTFGDKIYLFGGTDESFAKSSARFSSSLKPMSLLNHLSVYNVGEVWLEEEPETPPPPARYGHRAVIYNNKMYVFFGMGESEALDDIWEYDPETRQWREIIPVSLIKPAARDEHSATVVEDDVYIIGGLDSEGNPLSDCWKYNFSSNQWEERTSFGKASYGHNAFYYNGFIHLYGGYLDDLILSAYILSYSIGDNQWSLNFPTGTFEATSNAAAVQFGGRVFLFGGLVYLNGLFYKPNCYSWDLTTHSFERVADGPPVAYSAAAYIPSGSIAKSSSNSFEQFLLFGGENNLTLNNDTWIYTSTIGTVGLDDNRTDDIPIAFKLFQNYPNPFNSSTLLSYRLAENTSVVLSIYDIQGKMVKKLVNERQPLGTHTVMWDATDDMGRVVNSGIYLYRLTTSGGFNETKSMLHLK